MNNELMDFLARVHKNLHKHPFFRAETGEIRKGLTLYEARGAIFLFLNSEIQWLTLPQLSFLSQVLDRKIVPKETAFPFRLNLLLKKRKKKKIFFSAMFRARQKVLKEIEQRGKHLSFSPKTE